MTIVVLSRRNLLAAGGSVLATGVLAAGASGLLLPARADGLAPTDSRKKGTAYADAISNVGSWPTLNDTERAIKHFSAAASCRRRATFSSEPAASLACGRNVTLSNCPALSACSISTPEASSLYATTTIPASAQRCRYQS